MSLKTGNEGFLLAEDAAIKRTLSDLTVPDAKHPEGETVRTHFRYPDSAGTLELKMPAVLIDMIGLMRAPDRESRAVKPEMRYFPSEQASALDDFTEQAAISSDLPIPVDIIYQISTLCRSPQQSRYLTGQLMGSRLPIRDGWCYVSEDETWRRLFVEDSTPAPMLDRNGRQVHRMIYNVRLESEILIGASVIPRAREIKFIEEFGNAPVYGALIVY